MIKAIQTRYKGWNFRSRLEARYAVFFDALGVEWEYEPEGFELPDGTRYLPDFWLPSCGLYVEIKGQVPTNEEMLKCDQLALGTGKSALIVHGLPESNPGYLCCWDTCDSGGGLWMNQATVVFPNSSSPTVISHDDTRVDRDRSLYWDSGMTHWVDARYAPFHAGIANQKYAANAARSARFEFGQSGATA